MEKCKIQSSYEALRAFIQKKKTFLYSRGELALVISKNHFSKLQKHNAEAETQLCTSCDRNTQHRVLCSEMGFCLEKAKLTSSLHNVCALLANVEQTILVQYSFWYYHKTDKKESSRCTWWQETDTPCALLN